MRCLMPRSTKRSVASARYKRMTASHGLTCSRRTMTSQRLRTSAEQSPRHMKTSKRGASSPWTRSSASSVFELVAADNLPRVLAEAPWDDEPETPEEALAVQEAYEGLARGEVVSHVDLRRELGW